MRDLFEDLERAHRLDETNSVSSIEKEVYETTLEYLYCEALSAINQVIGSRVSGYDSDWCSDAEEDEQLDRAVEAVAKEITRGMFENAPTSM